MGIEISLAYHEGDKIKQLFTEYTKMLTDHDSSFSRYLVLQNYDEEIKHLEKKYGLPEGRLYLVRVDGEVAGCIALRKLDEENCEMKRLYVKPTFRGQNISDLLVNQVLSDAKDIGYKYMLLDTLPFLEQAIHLYQKHGFYPIGAYNDSPVDETLFMRCDIK